MQFPVITQPAAPADAETLKRRAMLYLKINQVITAMKRVPKNGYNDYFKYSYSTESDLVDAIRVELEAVKLAFLPPRVLDFEIVERPSKRGLDYIARVMIEYTIVDCETGEAVATVLIAEGSDASDKAFYKAYSAGTKYFLMKTFLVSTGDDPEQATPAAEDTTAPPTLRSSLLASLKCAIATVPAERKPTLTRAQVDAMTDNDVILLISTLLTVSPVEGKP